MTPKQRDVVLIPVPFTDLSTAKRRPVLVLSKTAHNRKSPDVVVAAITSNLASGGVHVSITAADFEEGTLPLDSLVRADKIYTLSKAIIVRKFGRLNQMKFQHTLIRLDTVLGK